MSCTDLAGTGTPLAAILTVAGACLLAGLALLIAARSHHHRTAAALAVLLLLGAVGSGLLSATPAHATPAACKSPPPAPGPAGHNYLSITQTSMNTGLAPGRAPSTITGIVTNHGTSTTYITTVTVHIAAVARARAAPAGQCDTSDYSLRKPSMPVARTLKPGTSATFTGATIGFNNKTTNQDACKHATLILAYQAT